MYNNNKFLDSGLKVSIEKKANELSIDYKCKIIYRNYEYIKMIKKKKAIAYVFHRQEHDEWAFLCRKA